MSTKQSNGKKCEEPGVVSENKDLLTNRSESSTAPHARMIENGSKFDLSPYCKVGLIDSISRLTSVTWAFKTIFGPAKKIMWRSLFMDDAATNIQALFTALSTNSPVTEVPLKAKSGNKSTGTIGPNTVDTEKRSWPMRIVYFVCIGIPLAFLVGIVYGICNFIQGIVTNLLNIIGTIQQLATQLREDASYYQAHPDELPPRPKAIEAVSTQVVTPYVSRLVRKKIPIIGSHIAGPFEKYFGDFAAKRVNAIYSFVEQRAKK